MKLHQALIVGLAALFSASAAKATPALVVDVDTQAVLFAEEAGVPWYPASTTKLMTALVVFEALKSGEVTMETPVVMSRKAMSQISLHAGLSVGQAMTLEDAIFATLAGSANEVAVALAETVAGNEAAFVSRMNAVAERLGLSATNFVNANGTFDRAQRTSARDLALLGMVIDKTFPEHRHFFQATGIVVDGKEVDSFNDLLSRFPGTVGMKTGFLCASGRNLVGLTERDGRRLMVVLLGATTDRERGERAAQLLTQAFSGTLSANQGPVEALPNRPEVQPEDMRMRLCTDQAAKYEAGREALYPMGLPGHESYLGPSTPANRHVIRTWMTEPAADVPKPLPRPAGL
jgi:D-alanyl-D-alanine carboxypeptidase